MEIGFGLKMKEMGEYVYSFDLALLWLLCPGGGHSNGKRGYQARPWTHKEHPKHVFFRYENRPQIRVFACIFLNLPVMSFPKFVYMTKNTPFFPNFACFRTPKRCTRVHCLVLKNNPNYVNFWMSLIPPLTFECPPQVIMMISWKKNQVHEIERLYVNKIKIFKVKGALDNYNSIPGIFIPLEVLAWVMTACWGLHCRLIYFWRNISISSIFNFSKLT